MRAKKLHTRPLPPASPAQPARAPADPPQDGEPAEADFAAPSTPPVRPSGLQSMGSTIGGIIAGIENQVFGRPPPGPVLVRPETPSGGTGPDGVGFTIEFPDDSPGPPPPFEGGSTRIGG